MGNHIFSSALGAVLTSNKETEAESGRQIWPRSPSREIAEPFGSVLWSRSGRRVILESNVSEVRGLSKDNEIPRKTLPTQVVPGFDPET